MTVQRAGVCSWKSLMAFMRTKMDKNNFKIFKCDLKIQALIDSYDQPNVSSQSQFQSLFEAPSQVLTEEARWKLVQKYLAALSLSIDKLFEDKIVGSEYVQKSYELLTPVHQWVKDNKPHHLKDSITPELKDISFFPVADSDEVEEWKQGALMKPSDPLESGKTRTTGQIFSQNQGSIIDKMQSLRSKMADPKEITNILNEIIPLAEHAWLDKDDYGVHTALNMLISAFPLENTFWKDVINKDPDAAEDLIVSLGVLQKLYFKTCWTMPHVDIVFPERVLAVNKLFYIQGHLAEIRKTKELWPKIKPQSSWLNRFINPRGSSTDVFYFHLPSQKENDELEEIDRWLSEDSSCALFKDNDCTGDDDILRVNKNLF